MYENLEILKNVVVDGSVAGTTAAVKKLDEREFNRLQYAVRGGKYNITMLEGIIAEEKLDRTVDYEKMIKQAKKRFNDIDISILQLLLGSECSYYTRGIRASMEEDDLKYNEHQVLKRCRRLKRLGLVQLDRGLFDEDDGMIAGSGWSINYKRHTIAQRIVDTVRGPEQTSLEDQ